MTEIRFYHLQKQSVDQALPAILGKALQAGRRAVVRLPDSMEVERLNQFLWTYRSDSFLPHGSKKDGCAEDQPIWLTDQDENPNGADVLVLNGTDSENIDSYALCCEMLDGRDETAVAGARNKWKAYKDAGHTITYWQQNERGAWEEKTSHVA